MKQSLNIQNFNADNAIKQISGMRIDKNKVMELVLIIDQSGSMSGREEMIQEGYDKFIQKLRGEFPNLLLTTVGFDDYIRVYNDGQSIQKPRPFKYETFGCTAEFDAFGVAIDYVNHRKNNPSNPNRNADVCYFGITDGYENASHKFSKEEIQEKIKHETNRTDHGKRSLILFTEYDVNQKIAADELGINESQVIPYVPNKLGFDVLFNSIGMAVEDMAKTGEIQKDYQERVKSQKIDGMTIKQLEEEIKKYEKIFDTFGAMLTRLEISAQNGGLDARFMADMKKAKDFVVQLSSRSANIKGDGIVQSMVADFMKKQESQIESIKKIAAKCELKRILDANEFMFAKLRINERYNNLKKDTVQEIIENLKKYDLVNETLLSNTPMTNEKTTYTLQKREIEQFKQSQKFKIDENKTQEGLAGLSTRIDDLLSV